MKNKNKNKLKINKRTVTTKEGKSIVLSSRNELHKEVQLNANNRHQVVQSKKTKHPRKQKNKGNKIDLRKYKY